ncbi:MAG: hypothetical protein IJ540_01470 [Prevotella sp.]|nr:hypothetical protein [Prevotella sp.]
MKTTKFFLMAALALTFAACSNDDNDILNPAQTAKGEGITITATLAPKDAGATTREVSEGTNEIVASWDTHEHIAILYTVGSEKKKADATITAVDGTTGVATISFTVESGTPDNTECTLVYPGDAAKADNSGVKDAAELLAEQDGRLSYKLDVRVGAGKIKTSTPGLDVTTQPAAQFAIFKFTVKNSDASATIDVKPLTITIGTQNYVITPSSAKSTLYAALPAVSGKTVSFSATGSDSKTYIYSKDNVTFTAGKYYVSTLKMKKVVIWTNSDLLSGSGNSFIKDGITMSCVVGHYNFANKIFVGLGKFTSSVGNFTKIEVTAKQFENMGSGWTVTDLGSSMKATWTGTASSEVSFGNTSGGMDGIIGMGVPVTMVFTLE